MNGLARKPYGKEIDPPGTRVDGCRRSDARSPDRDCIGSRENHPNWKHCYGRCSACSNEQREPGAGADIAIHDQLVLSENSLGFVLVDIVARQIGAIVAGGIVRVEGAGQGRVDVAGQQLAEAA